MSKKTVRLLINILVISLFLTICIGTVTSLAASVPAPNAISVDVNSDASSGIRVFGGKIVGTLQTVGTVISVVILIVLGIKYMIGSAEEKAEYKKTMMPYLIGALLIFAAVTIANVIFNFVNSM